MKILKHKLTLVLLGALLSIIIIEAGLRLGGGLLTYLQNRKNIAKTQDSCDYVILALGESTTFCGILSDIEYPEILERKLKAILKDSSVCVINKGVNGTNTTAILRNLPDYIEKYQPDIVTTMMGINDYRANVEQAYHVPSTDSFQVVKLFRILIAHIKARADSLYEKSDDTFTDNKVSFLEHRFYDYLEEEKIEKAELLLREIANNKEIIPEELGSYYIDYSHRVGFKTSKSFLSEEIKSNPENIWAHIALGHKYRMQAEYTKSEKHFLRALKLNPDFPPALRGLKLLYLATGSEEKLEQIFSSRPSHEDNYTAKNYRRVNDILQKNGIRHIAIQYPMRSISELKNYFTEKDQVKFVDNEKSFKRAVHIHGYEAIFKNRFGGDFGHMTERGKKIIADNILEVVLEEISY